MEADLAEGEAVVAGSAEGEAASFAAAAISGAEEAISVAVVISAADLPR